MRKNWSDCAFYSQIDDFIDKDLKEGLEKSKESRHNGTVEDDWDKVQIAVSAHLDCVSLLWVVLSVVHEAWEEPLIFLRKVGLLITIRFQNIMLFFFFTDTHLFLINK